MIYIALLVMLIISISSFVIGCISNDRSWFFLSAISFGLLMSAIINEIRLKIKYRKLKNKGDKQ